MRRLLQRLFFNNEPLTAYRVVNSAKIHERVILTSGEERRDVSKNHCIVCQTPFVVAIWLSEKGNIENNPNLEFLMDEVKVCSIRLKSIGVIHLAADAIYLFTVTKSFSNQLSFFKRYILFYYFYQSNRDKIAWRDVIDFSVLYSFPRKVIITSFRGSDHFNIFPMDFQGYIKNDKTYILGLRKTNVTLARIIADRKVVVGNVTTDHVQHVYSLGKHHSKQVLDLQQFPFAVFESNIFKFFLPDFVASYKEIEITAHQDFGSHVMLIGKVLHEQHSIVNINENLFHHLHLLQFLNRLKAGHK